MNTKTISVGAIILGILFIILAIIYWITPAGSLPHFIPGYIADSTTIHFKHGLGAFILGLGAFAYAWFKSAKKTV